MKKVLAVIVLVGILVASAPLPARAGGLAEAALALGAFAVFNQLFLAPLWWAGAYQPTYVTAAPVYASPVYATPSYAYATPSYAPAPPAVQREVVYPHGRYILYGDGVSTPYKWVWVPNPPPPGSAPSS